MPISLGSVDPLSTNRLTCINLNLGKPSKQETLAREASGGLTITATSGAGIVMMRWCLASHINVLSNSVLRQVL
jgi:hypothetical protein